jgi:uncharacterized membrane protein
LAYWHTNNPAWATATPWLLGAGLVMAALAAVMGLIDVFGDRQIRQLSTARWHAGANVLVVLIELYNLFFRYQQGPSAIVPNGLGLSLIAVLLLLFSGWKGGDLVFRGRIGVADKLKRITASVDSFIYTDERTRTEPWSRRSRLAIT